MHTTSQAFACRIKRVHTWTYPRRIAKARRLVSGRGYPAGSPLRVCQLPLLSPCPVGCVCVCARARVCVRACVRACVCRRAVSWTAGDSSLTRTGCRAYFEASMRQAGAHLHLALQRKEAYLGAGRISAGIAIHPHPQIASFACCAATEESTITPRRPRRSRSPRRTRAGAKCSRTATHTHTHIHTHTHTHAYLQGP